MSDKTQDVAPHDGTDGSAGPDGSETSEGSATCGRGLAGHAGLPAQLAVMYRGLAETLELHRELLVLDDERSRREDEVYRDLASRWRRIAGEVDEAAERMSAQRDLPMGAHDESAWSERHRRAFETFVRAQRELISRLESAARQDERMLESMPKS